LALPKCGPVEDIPGASYERTSVIVPTTCDMLTIMLAAAAIAGLGLADRDVSEIQPVDWHAENPNLAEEVSI